MEREVDFGLRLTSPATSHVAAREAQFEGSTRLRCSKCIRSTSPNSYVACLVHFLRMSYVQRWSGILVAFSAPRRLLCPTHFWC